jgi:hypothetical protein
VHQGWKTNSLRYPSLSLPQATGWRKENLAQQPLHPPPLPGGTTRGPTWAVAHPFIWILFVLLWPMGKKWPLFICCLSLFCRLAQSYNWCMLRHRRCPLVEIEPFKNFVAHGTPFPCVVRNNIDARKNEPRVCGLDIKFYLLFAALGCGAYCIKHMEADTEPHRKCHTRFRVITVRAWA